MNDGAKMPGGPTLVLINKMNIIKGIALGCWILPGPLGDQYIGADPKEEGKHVPFHVLFDFGTLMEMPGEASVMNKLQKFV